MKRIIYKYSLLMLLFIIIIATATAFIMNFLNQNQSNKSIDSPRPGITKNSNKISYSLYSQNGDLIDNGSPLTPNNGKIHKTVSLSHFIDEKRNYALIVLVDFKQVSFKVNNQEYETYEFSMKPNTETNIDTLVNVTKGSKEIDYLIIKKPDYLLEEKDIGRASVLQEVISMRYSLNNQNQQTKEVVFQKPLKEISNGPIDSVFLSRKLDRLGIIYDIQEQKNVYLSSGNLDNDTAQRYALVAFLNWKQVPIMHNRDILFTSVRPDTKQIFNIELPSTDTQKNYQILAFPQPFNVSKENFASHQTFGTIRAIIKSKN